MIAPIAGNNILETRKKHEFRCKVNKAQIMDGIIAMRSRVYISVLSGVKPGIIVSILFVGKYLTKQNTIKLTEEGFVGN